MKNAKIESIPSSSVKTEDIPYNSCGSSSGMVIRSSIDNAIHVKKEEEGITDNGNQNTHDDCSKGKDNGTSRTIRDGLFRVPQNAQQQQQQQIKKEEKQDNNEDLHDFSDWNKGNWCWLSSLPATNTSKEMNRNTSTHTTAKSEGNNNNNDVSQTDDRKMMSTSRQNNNPAYTITSLLDLFSVPTNDSCTMSVPASRSVVIKISNSRRFTAKKLVPRRVD